MEHNSELELFLEQVFKVGLWNPAHQTLVKFESLGWKLPQLQIFSCDVLSWLLQRKVSLLILKWFLTFCSKLMQLLARKKHSFRCRGVTFITSVCNCEVVLRKVKTYSLRYQCSKKTFPHHLHSLIISGKRELQNTEVCSLNYCTVFWYRQEANQDSHAQPLVLRQI